MWILGILLLLAIVWFMFSVDLAFQRLQRSVDALLGNIIQLVRDVQELRDNERREEQRRR